MNVNNLLYLQTDYLLVTPTYNTAMGPSFVMDNKVSHDQLTGLLSGQINSSTFMKTSQVMNPGDSL